MGHWTISYAKKQVCNLGVAFLAAVLAIDIERQAIWLNSQVTTVNVHRQDLSLNSVECAYIQCVKDPDAL